MRIGVLTLISNEFLIDRAWTTDGEKGATKAENRNREISSWWVVISFFSRVLDHEKDVMKIIFITSFS